MHLGLDDIDPEKSLVGSIVGDSLGKSAPVVWEENLMLVARGEGQEHTADLSRVIICVIVGKKMDDERFICLKVGDLHVGSIS